MAHPKNMDMPHILCPHCGNEVVTKVIDSRPSMMGGKINGLTVRRRRQCYDCGGKFTTLEVNAALLPDMERKIYDHVKSEFMRAVLEMSAKNLAGATGDG